METDYTDFAFPKNKSVKQKKRLKLAKECNVCQYCDQHSETIVAAHYQGFRQQAFNKGTSQKPDDTATAFLCQNCHDMFDGRVMTHKFTDKIEKSEAFLFAIVKTSAWLARHVC